MSWPSKGWCCDALKESFERRHDRGIFVFATPPDSAIPVTFWLSMRCVQFQDMDRIDKLIGPPDVPITIQTWHPILYCPWCGVMLERHYRHQCELLVDPVICEEHRLK
jgi:hypothetical protein